MFGLLGIDGLAVVLQRDVVDAAAAQVDRAGDRGRVDADARAAGERRLPAFDHRRTGAGRIRDRTGQGTAGPPAWLGLALARLDRAFGACVWAAVCASRCCFICGTP